MGGYCYIIHPNRIVHEINQLLGPELFGVFYVSVCFVFLNASTFNGQCGKTSSEITLP